MTITAWEGMPPRDLSDGKNAWFHASYRTAGGTLCGVVFEAPATSTAEALQAAAAAELAKAKS